MDIIPIGPGLGQGQPGFEVLLHALLGLESVGHENERPIGKIFPEERREEWLGRSTDAGAGQSAALLHAPQQGLRGGSQQDLGEQVACRRN